MRRLTIMSGGAAQGLVTALADQFKAETGALIDATYGAVGAMKDKLLGGEPADLLILTSSLIRELTQTGHVVAGSAADIGVVETCIAVRAGDALPPVGNAQELGTALIAADAVYLPDPKLATAGIHFAKVLDRLGVANALAGRLKTFPNGATAMREMAKSGGHPIGSTQATEILATPGVALVGPLPEEFRLATVYTCGVCSRGTQPDLARRLTALLTSPACRDIRERVGFAG